jgi:MEDS: MEthanogen/methylotroph, DcmR Sensory domain
VALTTESSIHAPHAHVVQFYGHDHELAAGVVPYLAEAIDAGGVAIVIATEAHRRAFAAGLAAAGVDPRLTEAGLAPEGAALVMLDAREAMDCLLVDGRLAPHRFDKLVGDLVREAAAGGRAVRAYGEIVAEMWADGHVGAALELEGLWNGLGQGVEFTLYCAYPVGSIEAEGNVDAFHEVCRQHSAVVGAPVALPRLEDPPLELEAAFVWGGRGPADARRFVIETLTAWGCGHLIDDAAVVTTELATNAVLHARTDFTVTICRRPDGTIRVAVRDSSLSPPQRRQPRPFDRSGRGLRLVEAMATGWGADLLPGGKVVWAQLT